MIPPRKAPRPRPGGPFQGEAAQRARLGTERGRLVLDSPYTQGVAGWMGDQAINLDHLSFDLDGTYGVLVASSASREPIVPRSGCS